jgi:phosphoglucosamine mutase
VLVRRHGLDMAAVVSASHNPWRDNGIKFFGPDGAKLDDAASEGIESFVHERLEGEPSGEGARHAAEALGRVETLEAARADYLRELASAFDLDLSGRTVALDCAHGATYRAAPAAFQAVGATVELIGADPDGRNINEGVGSTHPEALAKRVEEAGADLGFAFDGDGDRVIAVDGSGAVRDGDELIAIAAAWLRDRDGLGGGIAVTVMSNYGFLQAMERDGIEVVTTDVGDRHVSAALAERGWALGGEQSGHIIWTDIAPTGDGIAAALLVASALGESPLAEAKPFTRLPQLLRNVEVADRQAIAGAKALWDAVEQENVGLEGRGRVLVRPSGTEPLVRVMVEAPDTEECAAVCSRLVGVVERELG